MAYGLQTHLDATLSRLGLLGWTKPILAFDCSNVNPAGNTLSERVVFSVSHHTERGRVLVGGEGFILCQGPRVVIGGKSG